MSLNKFLFSRATAPETLKYTPKLAYIVNILNSLNHYPRTNTGAQEEVHNVTQKYKGEMFQNLHLKNYNATTMQQNVKLYV